MIGLLIVVAMIPVVTIVALVLVAYGTRPTSRYRAPHYEPGLRTPDYHGNPDALPVRPARRTR